MNSVIKGAGYVLVHTPEMVVYNGTTQTTERVVNPESEYLKELRDHLRSYDTCVNYWPNQVYIGNATPDDLAQVEFPYYDKVKEGAERYGKYGEIMPEDEFLLLILRHSPGSERSVSLTHEIRFLGIRFSSFPACLSVRCLSADCC